jgi:hypothetical protein
MYNYLNTLWEAVKGSPPRMYEFDDEYFVSLAMKITGDSFSRSMCQATKVAFIVVSKSPCFEEPVFITYGNLQLYSVFYT